MLIANQCAAKELLDNYKERALLRNHPKIDDQDMEKLEEGL